MSSRYGLIIFFFCVLIQLPGRGQDLAHNFRVQQDPIVSLEGVATLFFWNMRPIESDTGTPQIIKDHYRELNRGLRTGGSILFHLNQGFSLGLAYARFHTSHSTEENHWLINNVPRFGRISESFTMEFIGLKTRRNFEIDGQFSIEVDFTPGRVQYWEELDFAGYPVRITGKALGIFLEAQALYQFDPNWSVFLELGLFNSVLNQPIYTDPNVTAQPVNQPISLTNVNVGGGLRFTLRKKPKKNSMRGSYR